MIQIKMSDLDKRILSQVCAKMAADLCRDKVAGDIVTMAEAVDKMARLLYSQHVLWINEICQPETSNEPAQPKTN